MTGKQRLAINTGSEFVNILFQAIEQLGDTLHTWWRGHASSSPTWQLIPKVYRDPEKHGYCYEQNVASNFRRQAPARYQDCPTSDLDWLFLMQHYGVPTKLLDWTLSPLVALFFAVSYEYEKYESEPAILWAMNPMWLNQSMGHGAGIPTSASMASIVDMSRAAFDSGQETPDEILALYPPHRDVRMLVQQAAVTIHGTTISLEEVNDANASKEFLIPITITPDAKQVLRIILQGFHINLSTLFPDLQHLAEEVSSHEYIPGDEGYEAQGEVSGG